MNMDISWLTSASVIEHVLQSSRINMIPVAKVVAIKFKICFVVEYQEDLNSWRSVIL